MGLGCGENKSRYYGLCLTKVLIIIRYLVGPFPELVCQLEYLAKNVPILHATVVINFVLIVRYVFTFHSKNPTAVQDDFWTLFLNLWTAGSNPATFLFTAVVERA